MPCWIAILLGSPLQPKLSAAQRCNDDVLDEIFAHLSLHALAMAAQVCQSWLPSARRRLYTSVRLDACSESPEPLARTLSHNPDIRLLIRHLTLSIYFMTHRKPACLEWVRLLHENSLRSVEFEFMYLLPEDKSLLSLLDFPAIRTSPRLFIDCHLFLNPDRLVKVLSMPYLESLSMVIPNDMGTEPLPPGITSYPKLQRLSIRTTKYTPLIAALLQALPSSLEKFDLVVVDFREGDVASLLKGLDSHSTNLRHLAIAGVSTNRHTFPVRNFVDDFISRCSSLETLLCARNTYSSQIFSRAPSTLVSLTLCPPWFEPFPSGEYAAALQCCRRLPRLSTLSIMDHRLYRQRCESLAIMCQEKGIGFQTFDGRYMNFLA